MTIQALQTCIVQKKMKYIRLYLVHEMVYYLQLKRTLETIRHFGLLEALKKEPLSGETVLPSPNLFRTRLLACHYTGINLPRTWITER